MYKVFFNDTLVILSNSFEFEGFRDGSFYIKYNFQQEISESLALLTADSVIQTLIIQAEDIDELWGAFRNHFKLIQAAGGLVTNSRDEMLLIHRNGMWDLPKGKIEIGEARAEAALREVEEECGITDLVLGKPLLTTYHTYTLKGKVILKETFWYTMQSATEKLTPQLEEGIDRVAWVEKGEAEILLRQTFLNIALVYEAYQQSR